LHSRSALTSTASTAVAVIILVATIGGYYLLLQSGFTSTTQSSSQQSTSSVSGVAAHNPVYYSWQLVAGYQISLPNLLGNYSQMAFLMSTKGMNYSESSNETTSYAVVGHPLLDGIPTTEVISNSTLLSISNGTRVVDQSVNNVIWMASNGTVIQSNENGKIETGAKVGNPDDLITPIALGGPFDFAADILSLNSTLVSAVNSSTISVGSSQMAATTYEPTARLAFSVAPFGFGYSVTVEAGVAQGTSFYVPVYMSIFGPPVLNGFNSELALTTITLVSITAA
jgi:hypothetical protein